MTFHGPSLWFLLLLLLVPLAWLRFAWRRRRPAFLYSSLSVLTRAGTTWAVRLRWLVPALRTAVLVLLIVCVARPRKPHEQSRVFTEGIAIQLILDRSTSMQAMDFELEGRRNDRLSVVKSVVRDFVLGTEGLAGRTDDLVGMISFAAHADAICPLTLDHDHLARAMKGIVFPTTRGEDGTAIGDALALGVERLHDLEQRADITGRHRIKSKVIVLLTDGENNRGDIEPETAARMAAAFGIRIYTIGAGTDAGWAPIPGRDVFGRQQRIPVRIDEESLRAIAEATGGAYFRATNTDALERIYARIDEMEKTTIEQRRYLQYSEPAVESITLGGVRLPPLLAVVVVLLAVETLLAHTRLRTVP